MIRDDSGEILFNALMQRSELLQKMLDPRRDIKVECGYPEGGLDPHGYRELFDEDPIANRVVNVMPKESWKNEPEVYEDEDSEATTEFEDAWESLANSLRGRSWYRGQGEEGSPIWEYLRRADELSGVGCFGIILLGLDDGQELSKPVRGVEEKWSEPVDIPVRGQESTEVNTPTKPTGNVYTLNIDKDKTKGRRLLFMRAFDESLVQIAQYETNPTSPRYGMPVMYSITFNDPNEWTKGGIGLPFATKSVHWTRVVHIADNCGSSEIFGTPRMKPVLPRILDLRKLYGGSAEMYWRGAFPGWSLETHPQLGGDVNVDAGALREQMEQYMNGLQRYMALMGMTAKSLAPQVVDPSAQIDVQIGAICIELAIPRRIFEGSERGELASSQDSDSWNDRMRARQGKYLTPRMIIPFIDRCIMVGVLPEPQGYSVVWPDLEALSELEKAQVAVQRVDAMAKYIGGNVEALIAPSDFLTRVMEMPQNEVDEVLEGAMEQLEKTHPDTDDEIVPGHVPAPPVPEEAPGTIKMREGEKVVTTEGDEVAAFPSKKVENYNPSQPRDSKGRWGSGGGAGGGGAIVKAEIQQQVDNAPVTKRFSDTVVPREDYVYRFVTKEDFDKALTTGELGPGRSADHGGTTNFSKEPIPIYGGAAKGSAGLLVEVHESALVDPKFYWGSKDLYAESHGSVPLTSASRAWGYQLMDGGGLKIVEVTDKLKPTDNWNPSQPRDANGQWGSGGGASMAPDKGGDFGGGASPREAEYRPLIEAEQKQLEWRKGLLQDAVAKGDAQQIKVQTQWVDVHTKKIAKYEKKAASKPRGKASTEEAVETAATVDTLKRVERFDQVTEGGIGRGAFVLKDGSLVDVGDETEGGGDHFGIFAMTGNPANSKALGVDPKLATQVGKDYDSGAAFEGGKAADRVGQAWGQLYDSGTLRVRQSSPNEVGIDLSIQQVSPGRIADLVAQKKLPKVKTYQIEDMTGGHYNERRYSATLGELAASSSWRDLERKGATVNAYNPNQPRDDKGRWGSGGGASMAPDKGGDFGGGGDLPIHTSPDTPELTFDPDNLNRHLASGGVVQVTTHLRSTLYEQKHAGMFLKGVDGIYVQRGKKKDFLGPVASPLVKIRLGRLS